MATLIDVAARWWEIVWAGECGSCRIVVLLVPFAIALALAAHVVLDRARSSVLRGTIVMIAVAAAVLVLAMIASRVEGIREFEGPESPFASARPTFRVAWLLLFLSALVELAGIVGLALVRLSRMPRPIAGGLYGIAIAGLVPSALWLRQLAIPFFAPRATCLENARPCSWTQHFVHWLAEVDAMNYAPGALAVVALLVVALTLRPRKKTRGDRPSIAIGALVALLGAAAFAATRGHAFDRRHPESVAGMRIDDDDNRMLPRAPTAGCRPPQAIPVLEIDGNRLRLDHRTVDGPALSQDLDTLRRNWDILHPTEAFPGALRLRIMSPPSDSRVFASLARAYDVGYRRVHFETTHPEEIETGTLGRITRWRACSVEAEIVPGENPAIGTDALVAAALDGVIEVPQIEVPVPCGLGPNLAPSPIREFMRRLSSTN